MEVKNCEFCNLTDEDKKWLLCETSYWDIYLADKQDYVGRCLLVLKRHCESLSGLNSTEWLELKNIIDVAEKILKTTLGADLCNWSCLMNNFYKDVVPNPHLHIHIRPRYKNPAKIDEKSFYDAEFGHHYDNDKPTQLSQQEMETLHKKLKPEFNRLFSHL